MLDNLVNSHDLRRLGRRLARGEIRRIYGSLTGSSQQRVERTWTRIQRPPSDWWCIPAVRSRWNQRVSGDPNVEPHEYLSDRHLSGRRRLRGLSLACGIGNHERAWARTGRFARIDGCDLSEPRIERARAQALADGLDGMLSFHVGDVLSMVRAPASYDVVIAENSLHHLTPLEEVFQRIESWLAPGGWLFVNDFVGPTRMQWTDRQIEAINGLLAALPERFRRHRDGSSIKRSQIRPSRLSMMLSDPSEAVESGSILPLLRRRFNVIEVHELGGSLLHMLLSEISQNFLGDDPETRRALRMCFDAEDLLLESGELHSDFAVVACRRLGGAGL